MMRERSQSKTNSVFRFKISMHKFSTVQQIGDRICHMYRGVSFVNLFPVSLGFVFPILSSVAYSILCRNAIIGQ
jgi:hypothetical protein